MDGIAASAGRAIDPTDHAFPGSARILVGRTREQAALRAELAAAIGGRGGLVLVGGEAGIGKTALARDLSHSAEQHGCRVLAGSCYDLTNTPPYGPWLDLFEECRRDPSLPTPPAALAGDRLARVTDQAALFTEVRRFLTELAAVHPAVLLLEDLHWADPASVDLLRHVGPHLRHWPLLVLATYRVDELLPGRPFAQQMPALIREADGQRIDLRRLDEDALGALVSARYGLEREAEERLVAYLARHADGNPFFATELLRTLEENALLRRDDGRWTLAALDRLIVPSLLRQVIDGRVARLGEATRKALALAAVIGQEVPLGLWAEVADFPEEELLEAVEQAVDASLLEADRDGTRVRFVHALTREALYEGILSPRRRLWHRRVAEALLTSPRADPDSVAFHLQESGDPRTWEWLVKAADRAQRAYAWRTAADRLRAATALLEGVDGKERTRWQLACRIGYLSRFSDPAGAIADVEAAERAAVRIGDSITAIELRWLRAVLLGYSDRSRDACENMKKGLEQFEAAPSEDALVWGSILVWFGFALPATDVAELSMDEGTIAQLHAAGLQFRRGTYLWFCSVAGLLESPIDVNDHVTEFENAPGWWWHMPAIAAFSYHGLALAHAALGRPDEAQVAWRRARELFAAYDHHAVIAFTLLDELRNVVLISRASDPALRRQFSADAEASIGRAGGAFRPGVTSRLAWLACYVLDGRWAEALDILDDLPHPGNAYLRREVTGARVFLASCRGEPDVAWEEIGPLFPHGPETEPGDLNHQEGLFLQCLAADLNIDCRDLPAASKWLRAHDAWLSWSGSELGRADGHLGWARYHRATGDIDHARTSASAAIALATTLDQPLVRLAAHRLLGEIETVAGGLNVAEAHLTTALDLADLCDVPFERALTLLALGELRARCGERDEAFTLLEEARRICIPLGAAPALARADAVAARLVSSSRTATESAGLTLRELDVLRLLVAGRTNLEIAEALFISRDTARTHVANIFRKLDVNSRAEAVDRAHRLGLVAAFPPPST